ncbi:MAG: hypothetical protein H0U28_14575 [Nocardioidaceae bacterium]|nr:hypothetical protein [Nocardioidaceae bacterium]
MTEKYGLPATKIAGMPREIEMFAHVVRPKRADPADPLVVFLHGRHSDCYAAETPVDTNRYDWPCRSRGRAASSASDGRVSEPIPSHLGYDYAQRLLASQGYVTVSIAANGINAQDHRLEDGGAAARATLVRRHLDRWVEWTTNGRYQADMRNVILVGHSRGGEGVDRASIDIPLSAPYRITGQVLIAPTDFGFQTAPYIPTVTVLPYCDGDVSDLQGQRYTDLGRDLTDDDTALRSSVLVMGANHNFFNTEWTPGIAVAPSFDDWGGDPGATCGRRTEARLSAAEQRRAAKTYLAGAVQLMADGNDDVLPMYDGSRVDVASAGDADIRTHAIGGGRELRKPGVGTTLAPAVGADTRICVGKSSARVATRLCGNGVDSYRTPHWPSHRPAGLPSRRAFEMRWSSAGDRGGLLFKAPLNLSTATSLDLRTVVDQKQGNVRLEVRLHDADGDSVLLTPTGKGFLPALPGGDFGLSKLLAQNLRVPLADVAGVDLGKVRRIDLIGVSGNGRIWVLDVAAVEPGLADVPAKRLARISLGDARVREGDGPGTNTMRVPFRIDGRLSAPARLVVLGRNYTDFTELPNAHVELKAGQTRGVIRFPFRPDRRDDIAEQKIVVSAYIAAGPIMTRDYTARVTLVDDDPAPRVSVTRVESPVAEGDVAGWTATLSRPVDYWAAVRVRLVAGAVDAPRLTVGDVPQWWLTRHLGKVPPLATPLHKTRPYLSTYLRPGRTEAFFHIPVKRDGRAEGREAVSLRVAVRHISDPVVRTVFVRDPG